LDAPLHVNTDADEVHCICRDHGVPKAYCLGHDWFDDGRAPYPVYSVETGEWMQDPRTPVEPFDTLADYFTTCYDARKEFSLRKLDRVVRELRVDPRAMKQGLTT
jgi:hypothetical protein